MNEEEGGMSMRSTDLERDSLFVAGVAIVRKVTESCLFNLFCFPGQWILVSKFRRKVVVFKYVPFFFSSLICS